MRYIKQIALCVVYALCAPIIVIGVGGMIFLSIFGMLFGIRETDDDYDTYGKSPIR